MKIASKNLKIGTLIIMAFCCLMSNCMDSKPDTYPPPQTTKLNVKVYFTQPDKSALLSQQSDAVTASSTLLPTITINSKKTYQSMDGFGYALTGGSAYHLFNMSASKRATLLNELFGLDGSSIGISYLRISIGASDLDASTFSYDDLTAGDTDITMANFSIAQDKQWLIPILKQILAINPNIKILGSPWSAPAWMKTSANPKGGSLKPNYFDAYSTYFVKYVQAMASEGITIDAVTIQNEPLYDGNNPSMYMSPEDQGTFVKNNLGPAFESAGIKTKIIIYDHNADRTDYPITILNDAAANKYIDGSAFHLYAGDISNLSVVHNAFPNKNLYFTEQWEGAPGDMAQDMKNAVKDLIIGASRNWCKVVLQWNLASNPALEPHTPGGCSQCLGSVTIDGDVVTHNPSFYAIGHASKFVRPGSVRIESNSTTDVPNVAFITPEGKIVIIVLNNTNASKSFNVSNGTDTFTSTLLAGAVATYVWTK